MRIKKGRRKEVVTLASFKDKMEELTTLSSRRMGESKDGSIIVSWMSRTPEKQTTIMFHITSI